MILNYFKIAFRNLVKNKTYTFINIGGLAVGMAVAMLIGLWIYDELSFDKYHKNYEKIAQLGQRNVLNGEANTWPYLPVPLATELRSSYTNDFEKIILSTFTQSHILSVADKKFMKSGIYIEPKGPEMFTLKMLSGSLNGLEEPSSVLISASVAKAYFNTANPINKLMKIDNNQSVKVTGVYEDFPYNSTLANISFMAPWSLFESSNPWMKEEKDNWNGNAFQIYVQLAEHTTFSSASAKIKDVMLKNLDVSKNISKPEIVLHPMNKWHLYQAFKNGVFAGGRIENVWLFGVIGLFVLLLACINFVNLSTARSEKRAKEVGIRKAIGSKRGQLVVQFFSESFLVVILAYVCSLFLVYSVLPFFNEIADKKMTILWANPLFWLSGIAFILFTSVLAGSYPALYLSGFQPIKVLKGNVSTIQAGRFSSLPRKALVVLQFTVSITMIIGTIIVFRQIQYAKNRPIGYNRDGLLMVQPNSNDIHAHFDVVKDALLNSGAIEDIAESEMPATKVLWTDGHFDWKGKDPNLLLNFPIPGVSYNYGQTVGWQFKQGRDFSKQFATDSSGIILNESAVRFMGLTQPINETIRWNNKPYKIIGVIKDMIMESPYAQARPSIFFLSNNGGIVNIKLNPAKSANEALSTIETVFKKYNPAAPFDYQFVDQEYAKKFGNEERVAQLTTFFSILAIFISCLGLFGLASFVAEQRTKEIGIRKVLGATIYNLWSLLSKDFILLVLVAFFIAIPTAYLLMNSWLQKYNYHTDITWWIFALSGIGALFITLLTVSFQAIRAALMNPVKSLKTE